MPSSPQPHALTFDALLTRSALPRKRRVVSAPIPLAVKLRDIEREARLIPLDREAPRAIVLVVLHTTCLNCQREYRAPNQHCLIRYDDAGLSHSIKYTKTDVMPFLGLPRETKLLEQTTPFCEACF